MNGILWRLHTGAPWRDIPLRYGPWKTVYDRFNKWRRSGLWEQLLKRLQVQLDQKGMIDWSRWNIDSTVVRASRSAAGAKKKALESEPSDHALGRSRGGFGTKVHLVSDAGGLILNVVLSGAQVHDSTCFESVMQGVQARQRRGRPRRRPCCVVGDKAYDNRAIRAWLRRRQIRAVIPERKDRRHRAHSRGLDTKLYRQRSIVEQVVGWHKERRSLGTRFEKLAVNFLALNHLALIEQYTRRLSSDRA